MSPCKGYLKEGYGFAMKTTVRSDGGGGNSQVFRCAQVGVMGDGDGESVVDGRGREWWVTVEPQYLRRAHK